MVHEENLSKMGRPCRGQGVMIQVASRNPNSTVLPRPLACFLSAFFDFGGLSFADSFLSQPLFDTVYGVLCVSAQ